MKYLKIFEDFKDSDMILEIKNLFYILQDENISVKLALDDLGTVLGFGGDRPLLTLQDKFYLIVELKAEGEPFLLEFIDRVKEICKKYGFNINLKKEDKPPQRQHLGFGRDYNHRKRTALIYIIDRFERTRYKTPFVKKLDKERRKFKGLSGKPIESPYSDLYGEDDYDDKFSQYESKLLENMHQAKSIVSKLGKSENDPGFLEIKKILEPNFGYMGLFTKFHFRDRISIDRIRNLYELIKTYSHLLRNQKIDPNSFDNFESLDDTINKSINYNEDLKFAKSFISNKYANLLNEDNIRLFGEIRKYESSHKRIQDYLTRKIAGFSNPEQFGMALQNLLDSLAGKWESGSIGAKIESDGGIIVYQTKDYIVAKIPNYRVCQKLGSSSWCIARSSSYFKQYVATYGIQYIVYNFKVSQSAARSMIGVTANFEGEITASHDKFDGEINIHSLERSPSSVGLNREVTSHLTGPNKNDILNAIDNGYRPNASVLKKFGLSKEDVEKVDSNYFKKIGDIDINNQSIEDISRFVSKRRLTPKDYLKFLQSVTDKNILFKLLDLKWLNHPEVLEIAQKLNAVQEFIDRYSNPKRILDIIGYMYALKINILDYDVSGIIPNLRLDIPENIENYLQERKLKRPFNAVLKNTIEKNKEPKYKGVSEIMRETNEYLSYIDSYIKKFPGSLIVRSVSPGPILDTLNPKAGDNFILDLVNNYEFVKIAYLTGNSSCWANEDIIIPCWDYKYIKSRPQILNNPNLKKNLEHIIDYILNNNSYSNMNARLTKFFITKDNFINLISQLEICASKNLDSYSKCVIFMYLLNEYPNRGLDTFFKNNCKGFIEVIPSIIYTIKHSDQTWNKTIRKAKIIIEKCVDLIVKNGFDANILREILKKFNDNRSDNAGDKAGTVLTFLRVLFARIIKKSNKTKRDFPNLKISIGTWEIMTNLESTSVFKY